PGTTFSYLMRLPDGSWTWWKAMVAPLLVAEYISTGIETSPILICPRQIGRAAMPEPPSLRASQSLADGLVPPPTLARRLVGHYLRRRSGCSSMVEQKPSKLAKIAGLHSSRCKLASKVIEQKQWVAFRP